MTRRVSLAELVPAWRYFVFFVLQVNDLEVENICMLAGGRGGDRKCDCALLVRWEKMCLLVCTSGVIFSEGDKTSDGVLGDAKKTRPSGRA